MHENDWPDQRCDFDNCVLDRPWSAMDSEHTYTSVPAEPSPMCSRRHHKTTRVYRSWKCSYLHQTRASRQYPSCYAGHFKHRLVRLQNCCNWLIDWIDQSSRRLPNPNHSSWSCFGSDSGSRNFDCRSKLSRWFSVTNAKCSFLHNRTLRCRRLSWLHRRCSHTCIYQSFAANTWSIQGLDWDNKHSWYRHLPSDT